MRLWSGLIVICMTGAFTASAETAAMAEGDAIPDAMSRQVNAPEIDFTNLRDPFSSYLVRMATRGQAALMETQMRLSDRKREKLEEFDLATLRLVAIFKMAGEHVAMVEDSTTKGYIVRRGNYIGQNNGKIEKITDDTIFLVEQVLNPAGEIIDRQVSLTMKEVNE
ncbi:Tfp pilus assembly protein PilP [Mariprofundus ferrinatatus]|uniref:Tfp pilus assembly protein PilP n=1 Tax=Mariprofundus ferrinatatus TaxID=1921087 RepID=A0A2K8L2R4_9PROT|nr:pilus assembly protein PilP [Mariprofundus ferrinatatus]ATX81392.1 Tfp pilus assembly protein PilP [Mariprofundus ferrinatatus]